MTFDTSPATEASTATPRPSPGPSSATPVSFPPPRTPDEAEKLLDACARSLRGAPSAQQTVRQLARFLGANSGAWTLANQDRLRVMLASRGAAVIEPLLDIMSEVPRTDVLDAVETVLLSLPSDASPQLSRIAVSAHVVAPPVRACFLRAAVRLDPKNAWALLGRALVDPSSAEVREAAASLVGDLRDARHVPVLHRCLIDEKSEAVREALGEAIASSGG